MNTIHTLLLAACCLSYVCCVPSFGGDEAGAAAAPRSHANGFLAGNADDNTGPGLDAGGGGGSSSYEKRGERYAFGLGRRAYMYTNGGTGMKRLPVYNFGLGKRTGPYSFGLGKRAGPYSFGLGKRGEYDYEQQYDGSEFNNAPAPAYMGDEKRNRPYSFGLGKRDSDSDADLDRRSPPGRYDFGMGRR